MASVKKAFEWHCSSAVGPEAELEGPVSVFRSESRRDVRLDVPQRDREKSLSDISESLLLMSGVG